MRVLKTYSLAIAMSLFYLNAIADFNPSNNQSATQMKTGNRNATSGIEAAFYNPAGTVFGKNGFAVEFSILPFTSTQSVYDSFMDKTYESKTSNLFYPALNLSYKQDKFAVFSNIGITNGGGAGNYDDGLPLFDISGNLLSIAPVATTITEMMMAGLLPADTDPLYEAGRTTSVSSFSGSAYGIGGSIGAAYKFSEWLSAAIAIQYSKQSNHQEGEVITTNALLGELPKTELDVDYTGSNMGFIFGLNLKPMENLLIAQTFRYYTELELETKVNDNKTGGGFVSDGVKSYNTYAPYYSLGISYNVSEKLRIETDINLSLYSMLENKDTAGYNLAENYNNGFDIGLGFEYQIVDMLNWGLGFTYAPAKMKAEKMTEMEFEMNSLWLNTGFTINPTEKFSIDLAVQFGIPNEEVTRDINYYGMIDTKQTYKKEPSFAAGIGLSYRF